MFRLVDRWFPTRDIMVRVVHATANEQKIIAGTCLGNLSAVAVEDGSNTCSHAAVDVSGSGEATDVDRVLDGKIDN